MIFVLLHYPQVVKNQKSKFSCYASKAGFKKPPCYFLISKCEIFKKSNTKAANNRLVYSVRTTVLCIRHKICK